MTQRLVARRGRKTAAQVYPDEDHSLLRRENGGWSDIETFPQGIDQPESAQ